MSAVITTSPARPYMYDDLAGMPDDGRRYELLDGVLVVSPAPLPAHQAVVVGLVAALRPALPDDLQLFVAPLDVVLADDTVVQPDVLVARRADVGAKNLPAAPVLAVEVLSPSTARVDRLLKASRYAAAGIAHYWVVDPAAPSVTVLALVGETYELVAEVSGDEVLELREPLGVRLAPRVLLDG